MNQLQRNNKQGKLKTLKPWRLQQEQDFRLYLINELTSNIGDNTCHNLAIRGEEKQIPHTYSKKNIFHVMDQSRYVWDTLIYLRVNVLKIHKLHKLLSEYSWQELKKLVDVLLKYGTQLFSSHNTEYWCNTNVNAMIR